MKEHIIITISRQYGSGGREISKILSEKLNIDWYDQKIVYLAAENMGETQENTEFILNKSYRTAESQISSIGKRGFENISFYNKIYREQAKVIQSIAKSGSAIFLGRCAQAILKNFSNHYNFYIYADNQFRENRGKVCYNNLSLKELEKEDKVREQYYNHYTGKNLRDYQNYDLMINTSQLSLEDAADLMIHYIEKKQAEKIIKKEKSMI